jgi:hypothetical protein
VGELLAVDWFAGVAAPAEAASLALSPQWEDFRLERRNDLTALVAVRLQNRGSEWNKCAQAFRGFFDSHISTTISSRLALAKLPDSLMSVVRWDIISYMQELNYSDVRRPAFFQSLWFAYQRGHLPCGWLGDYPDGRLDFR